MFFHTLKQAFALRYGSSVAIASLPLTAKAAMFRSVCSGAPDAFHRDLAAAAPPNEQGAVRVPVRVILEVATATALGVAPPSREGAPPPPFVLLQRPVPARSLSAGDTIALHLGRGWRDRAGSSAVTLFVAGVPLRAGWGAVPIDEMWTHLASPDGFLYLLCVSGSSPPP